MSFLEPFAEKPTVIIDIGTAYTKCGFSSESAPHAIIPTKLTKSCGKEMKIFDYKTLSNKNDLDVLKEILVEFLYKIFYKILNTNSRDRKVVIIESILTPCEFRNALADVLFNNFQILSVLFMPSHVASIYTLGISRALVLDCGYNDCQIIPIAEGMPLVGLCDFVDLGGKKLHKHIENLIKKYAFVSIGNKKIAFNQVKPEPELSEDILEDIKLRCCFVTTFERSRQYSKEIESKSLDEDSFLNLDFKFAPDCEYNLNNNIILHVPGFVRELAFEILFVNKLDDEQTIPSLILETLLKCPIDLKKDLASNVVLVGGTCMLTGFKNRLVNEINYLLNDVDRSYANSFSFKQLRYHVPPCRDNYTAWLGGSIFGSLNILDIYSLHNSTYKELDKLPDWFTISYKSDMVKI